ncbi:MAG: flagellar export chaperone FliS [Deltaproteobacteria bacterium]|nr:flagellar export chaperone FliS [Deltaproteobacteria bacterium]
MNYGKSIGLYKKTGVETAGKLELVIMCYEKTIHFLMQAKDHFKKNELENKARKMQKAMDIIRELQSCLNLDEGGQIAKNLDSIYIYLTKRLLQGDIEKDLTVFDEAINIMSELKEAWEGIASEGENRADSMTDSSSIMTNTAQIAA